VVTVYHAQLEWQTNTVKTVAVHAESNLDILVSDSVTDAEIMQEVVG